MEVCEGMNLRKWLQEHRGKISKEVAIRVFEALAKAVREMHAIGILHRDIKPENVFLSYDGEYKVQIIDFDLALVSEEPIESEDQYVTKAVFPKLESNVLV